MGAYAGGLIRKMEGQANSMQPGWQKKPLYHGINQASAFNRGFAQWLGEP